MKIITRTIEEESVYVQVKDLLYLGRKYKYSMFIDLYIKMLNKGKNDFDFVKVDEEYKKLICDSDLIDFKDTLSKSSLYISKTLVNMSVSASHNDDTKHNIEDMRSIMDFKRGELGYSIPLLKDGDTYFVDNGNYLEFSSTILPDCYVLRVKDGSNLSGIDYDDFLASCIEAVKAKYDKESRNAYSFTINNENLLVTFEKGKKSTKGFKSLKKVFGNKRKEN